MCTYDTEEHYQVRYSDSCFVGGKGAWAGTYAKLKKKQLNACAPMTLSIQIAKFNSANTKWEPFHQI